MDRDYGLEIDALRQELDDMQALLAQLLSTEPSVPAETAEHPARRIQPISRMHPDPRLQELMASLTQKAEEDGDTGAITYLGVFASGGRQSNWIRNEVSTDDLLRLIENNMAGKVLACIGNNERLRILLALMQGPKTVAQLVERCGYSSTGQVYHHLKPLSAANLIQEEAERGQYAVVSHRVQGIIMVLAGISDMLDPRYTEGAWDADDA